MKLFTLVTKQKKKHKKMVLLPKTKALLQNFII